MTSAPVLLPEPVRAAASAAASEEGVTLDDYVAAAVAAQLHAAERAKAFQARAARADFAKFRAILDRVPDVPPVPGDELP